MDSMQENLNKEILNNVFPYWRNHASLKGKQSDLITAWMCKLSQFFTSRLDFDELPDHDHQSSPKETLTGPCSEA